MPELSHGDAQDLLTAYKRGWEKRDPDALLELFAPDIDYRADPFSEPLSGLNAVRALWNDVCAGQANIEFDAERIWVSGTTVLCSWHAAFTRRASGERVRTRGFMAAELNDQGRIVRMRQWPAERVVGIDATFRAQGETN